eukprot:5762432-Pyramimonas_sp.AAC.1
MFFANITVAGPKAWDYIVSDQHPVFNYVQLVETHVDSNSMGEWQKKARQAGLRLLGNPARPNGFPVQAGFEHRSNEGGEWTLAQGHRSISSLASTWSQLFVPGHQMLDGFHATVVDMKGFSFVAVSFYGFSGEGWSARNTQRFARLGGLL